MFPLLLLLRLLCTEAVNVQDSFAESGLVNDLKILAPEKQLEVMPIRCHLMVIMVNLLFRFLMLDSSLLLLETAWQ